MPAVDAAAVGTEYPLMKPAPSLAVVCCLLASAAACETAVPHAPAPCPCDAAGCSDQACDIRVRVHEGCVADFSLAEVLVGDHLEAELVEPGAEIIACARVEPGDLAEVWVSGGDWRWGPEVVACDPPGGSIHTLTFQCVEAGAEAASGRSR